MLIGGIPLPGAAVYINHHRLRNRWWQSAVSVAGLISSTIFTLLLAALFQPVLTWNDTEYWWICPDGSISDSSRNLCNYHQLSANSFS